MIHLPIKIEGPVEMPRYATDGSAAFDLYAPVSGFVYPGDAKKIPLDIRVSIPVGYCGILTHRSSQSAKGVCAYGTIDSDFRGIVCVVLMNGGDTLYRWNAGDRVAQLRIVEVPNVVLVQVQEMSLETQRGEGGYGSTGV
jgi:dUTP pyrophosphatase